MAYKPKAASGDGFAKRHSDGGHHAGLLIIFMVITPMLQKGVSVDMAKAHNAQDMQDADKDDAVIIAITRDGSTFLGNQPGRSRGNHQRGQGPAFPTVSIRPSSFAPTARAKYGDVVKAVDEVRSAGVDNLGLLTQKISDTGHKRRRLLRRAQIAE